jgi:hypothetical protein
MCIHQDILIDRGCDTVSGTNVSLNSVTNPFLFFRKWPPPWPFWISVNGTGRAWNGPDDGLLKERFRNFFKGKPVIDLVF